MDAPVVAAALAEMARGDAYAARVRNAPQDANLTDSRGGGSGPSPAPPSRAGVVPRDAHGRGREHARSHWVLLTGVLVGVLLSNAAHATSASGAVLASEFGSESFRERPPVAPPAAERAGSRWRALAGAFGKAPDEHARFTKNAGTRGTPRVSEDIAAATFSSETRSRGAPWRRRSRRLAADAKSRLERLFERGLAFGRHRVPAFEVSSFAFGRFATDAPTSLSEWRRGGGGGAAPDPAKPARPAKPATSFSRTADVLGLANCPRLRVLRDLLLGDGRVAELVGVAEFRDDASRDARATATATTAEATTARARSKTDADGKRDDRDEIDAANERRRDSRVFVVRALPLGLFLVCPGAVLALRAHELWGLDSFEGAAATTLGFASVAMWCQGSLELYAHWRECPTRRRRAAARAAARDAARRRGGVLERAASARLAAAASASLAELSHAARDFVDSAAYRVWVSRGAFPGAARAVTLEALCAAARVKGALEGALGGGPFEVFSRAFAASPVRGGVFPVALARAARRLKETLTFFGAVGLPAFRALHRAWHVTGRHAGRPDADAFFRRAAPAPREGAGVEAARAAGTFAAAASGPGAARGAAPIDAALAEPEFDRAGPSGDDRADGTAGRTLFSALGTGTDDRSAAPAAPAARGAGSSASHWPEPVRLPPWLDEEKAPQHFRCPITLCVIREPAVTPAGISYERSALMQWLEHQHTEPSTKRRLKRSRVVPNLTLRAMIEDWLADARAERARAAPREAPGRFGAARAGSTRAVGATESLSPSVETRPAADGDDASARSSRLRRPGLPAGASAVSQEARERLRAARRRMYAALKRRAASGASAEEQRWADVSAARGGGTTDDGGASSVSSASSFGFGARDASLGTSRAGSASAGGTTAFPARPSGDAALAVIVEEEEEEEEDPYL